MTTPPADPVAPVPPVDAPHALRYDEGKERLDMVPVHPLFALARVYAFGAQKYARNNWRKGASWTQCFAAMLRHAYKWLAGEDVDPESGEDHLLHVAFWAFALYEWRRTGVGKDDRYRATPATSAAGSAAGVVIGG